MLLHAWASAQVQDLVAELARVRRNKIQAGLRELQSALSAVKLLNLGYMEVNQIRPFFKGSLDRFFRLLPACPALALCLWCRLPGYVSRSSQGVSLVRIFVPP